MSVIKYLADQAQEGVKISDKTFEWQAELEQLTEHNAHVADCKYWEFADDIQVYRKAKAHQKGTCKLEMAYDQYSKTGKTTRSILHP